jgi:hypothetical protein
MWDPRHLTTLQASTACYRDSFTLWRWSVLPVRYELWADCLDNVGSLTSLQASTACYRDSFTFFCVVFIVCNVSFIVYVALCVMFCLSMVCYFVWYVYFYVLSHIVVPLPPGKTTFAVQLNSNNVSYSKWSKAGKSFIVIAFQLCFRIYH